MPGPSLNFSARFPLTSTMDVVRPSSFTAGLSRPHSGQWLQAAREPAPACTEARRCATILRFAFAAAQNGNIFFNSSADGCRPYSQTSKACAYWTFFPRSAP